MVKKKHYDSSVLYIIGALGILVTLYLVFSAGNITLTATQYDKDGNIIAEEDLAEPIGTVEAQSFFGTGIVDESFLLQSTQPVEEENTFAQLKAVISNTDNTRSRLRAVQIYKNGRLLYEKAFTQIFLDPSENYIYMTELIDLKGLDAQLNTIRMEFTLTDPSDTEFIQIYEYQYFSLTPCESNKDCEVPNNVCDVNNAAGFSRDAERYCVKPCTDNSLCYPGQVCKSGYCGY